MLYETTTIVITLKYTIMSLYFCIMCSPVLTDTTTISHGQELENGAWTGLIGMLQRREIDMGLAYMAITADKLRVMDITTYIMNDVYVKLYIVNFHLIYLPNK